MSGTEQRTAAPKADIATECIAHGMDFCRATYGKAGHLRLMAVDPEKIDIGNDTTCLLVAVSGLPWSECATHVPRDQRALGGRGFSTGWGGLTADDLPLLTTVARTAIIVYQAAHH